MAAINTKNIGPKPRSPVIHGSVIVKGQATFEDGVKFDESIDLDVFDDPITFRNLVSIIPTVTIAGDATQSYLKIVATMPAVTTAIVRAIDVAIVSAGSSSQFSQAFNIEYLAGYTGDKPTVTFRAFNEVKGTSSGSLDGSTGNAAFFGLAFATGSTTGDYVGVHGVAKGQGATSDVNNFGVIGCSENSSNGINIGVVGASFNPGNGRRIGGCFILTPGDTPVPAISTFPSAAVYADNGATVFPIIVGRDNGVTVFELVDGGDLKLRKAVALGDLAGDPTLDSGDAAVYAKDVTGTTEVHVKDSAANVTQISPHDENGEWVFSSRNAKTGRVLKIRMERLMQLVAEHFDPSLFEEFYE